MISLKNIFLFVFLIKTLSTQNSDLIIEFNSSLSKIPNNLTSLEFLNYLVTNELYININIGIPNQNIDLLIDFDSYYTYFIKEVNTNNKIYNDSLSTTFRNIGNNEYFEKLNFKKSIISSDLITINENIKNLNYTFLYVLDKKLKKNINFPGVLGVGVVSNGEPFYKEAGFIYQLKKNNISNNYLYTLNFNDNDFNGKLIIGKNIYENYSYDNFINDYCIITYEFEYYWGWDRVSSYYGSKELEIKNIYLKPELGVIIVNVKVKELLKEHFFKEKIKEGKCYENFKLYYSFFYCDKDVIIDIDKFYFQIIKKGPQIFFLDFNDLTIEYNNKIYFLIIFAANFPSDQAYFGYPFFKKFDVIFNQDSRTVGFYNINKKNDIKNKNEKNTNNNNINDNNKFDKNVKNKEKEDYIIKQYLIKVLQVAFIILCILLSIYSIFYIYRKIKRKTKEKLIEEFNSDN